MGCVSFIITSPTEAWIVLGCFRQSEPQGFMTVVAGPEDEDALNNVAREAKSQSKTRKQKQITRKK